MSVSPDNSSKRLRYLDNSNQLVDDDAFANEMYNDVMMCNDRYDTLEDADVQFIYKLPYNSLLTEKEKLTNPNSKIPKKWLSCAISKLRVSMHPHFNILEMDIPKFIYNYNVSNYVSFSHSSLENDPQKHLHIYNILQFIDYLVDHFREFLENYHDVRGNNILQCIRYCTSNPWKNPGALIAFSRLIQRLDININERNSNNDTLFFNLFQWDCSGGSNYGKSLFTATRFEDLFNYILMQMYILNYDFKSENLHYNMYKPRITGKTPDILIRSITNSTST